MATSRVGESLDALVDALTLAVAPIPLVDGPLNSDDPLEDLAGIGWDGDREGDFEAVVDWTQDVVTIDGEQDEMFSVLGFVSCWQGDSNEMRDRRERAFELLTKVQDAINDDPTLGGLPVVAEFNTGQLYQEQGRFGEQARITFTILVRANR